MWCFFFVFFSKDAPFAFTRFVIEVELSSLKTAFTFQPGIFLINGEKGVLGYKAPPSPPLFSLLLAGAPRRTVKANGFSLSPGANQMSFVEPWRSNSFEVSQMSRILIFWVGIKASLFILPGRRSLRRRV